MMMPTLQSTPEPTTRQSAPSFRCWRRARCRRAAVLCCSCSWARAYWQVAGAEFLDVRQFVEIAQTEMIEEKVRCLVKQRTPRNFGTPGNFDESALHQGLQNAVDRDAADRFDIGARDRLTVSNDGEGFERGRA